jgi:hypothetical protein
VEGFFACLRKGVALQTSPLLLAIILVGGFS